MGRLQHPGPAGQQRRSRQYYDEPDRRCRGVHSGTSVISRDGAETRPKIRLASAPLPAGSKRRRISDGELAHYCCWSPTGVTLAALVRVAGIRWCVEECFQAAKGEVGLDQQTDDDLIPLTA